VAYFGIAILVFGVLAGCGSKPDESDIRTQVDEIFRCGPFHATEIKKTDGASLPNNQYQVAFNAQVEIKGGKSAATTLFANILQGVDDVEAARNARNLKPFDLRTDDDQKLVTQKETQLQALKGGDCESIQTSYLLEMLIEGTKAKLKTQTGPIAIPYIAKIHGVADMRKAESGWLFTELSQFSTYEVIESEPQPFDRPSAKSLIPEAPAPSSTSVSLQSAQPQTQELTSAPAPAPAPAPAQVQVQVPVPVPVPAKVQAQSPASTHAPAPPEAQVQSPASTSTQARNRVVLQDEGIGLNCIDLSTKVKKLICSDPELIALQTSMAKTFKDALARTDNKKALKMQQVEWRQNVRNLCSSTDCLRLAFERRLEQLR
jgi:hypothetical protein